MQDLYIPTADAARLLSLTPRNCTGTLHRLKVPCKKDFNTRLWSRNAIYAILKQRRQALHPPPGYIFLADIAACLHRSESYTLHLLQKHHIKPSYTPIWNPNKKRFYKTPIYSLAQKKQLLREISFEKSSFPPEGWLTVNDCASFLSRSPESVRYIAKLYNVRIKKIHHAKQLYNEDDIVHIRKYHLRHIHAGRPPKRK